VREALLLFRVVEPSISPLLPGDMPFMGTLPVRWGKKSSEPFPLLKLEGGSPRHGRGYYPSAPFPLWVECSDSIPSSKEVFSTFVEVGSLCEKNRTSSSPFLFFFFSELAPRPGATPVADVSLPPPLKKGETSLRGEGVSFDSRCESFSENRSEL